MGSERDQQGNDKDRGESGESERGFAAMDEEKRRKIAEKGGEASARQQKRDDEGQFAGKERSSGGD